MHINPTAHNVYPICCKYNCNVYKGNPLTEVWDFSGAQLTNKNIHKIVTTKIYKTQLDKHSYNTKENE